MKYTVFVLIAGLLVTACNNNASQTNTGKSNRTDSIATQQDFFPVADYIGGQLKIIIDSLQLPLSKAVTLNNKTRLSGCTDAELRQWARDFRQPDINDSTLKKFYTETNIADQSVPSVTLIYATTNTGLPVQKINVYIKPDPVENDKVTGIYIEKAFSRNDTIFNQQLYWKTGKNMQVTTEKQVKGKSLPVEKVKIMWDPSE